MVKREHSERLMVLTLLILIGFPSAASAQQEFVLSRIDRFGSLDGELSLTRPVDVWAGEDQLFLLEATPPRVVLLDRSGRLQREFGSSGDGPGEFSFPSELGITGEHLWIADPNGGRLEIFDRNGDFIESVRVRVPADERGQSAVPQALLADGTYLAAPAGTPMSAVARGAVDHDTFYKIDRSGRVLETFYARRLSSTDFFMAELGGGRFAVGAHPLMEHPLVAPFPDGSGLVVVERWVTQRSGDAEFKVMIFDHTAELQYEVDVPYDPIPGGDWRRQEQEARAERASYDDRHSDDALVEAWSDRPFYPPVTDLKVGQDGRILVRREQTRAGPVRWMILNRSGTVEGEVATPLTTQLLTIDGEDVWGVERDDLDVPYLVKFRLAGR